MPTYKISQLTTATAVSATNQFEINQNGTSKSVEVSVIAAYIKSTSNLPVVVSVSSATDAVRITQTGTGNALVVEDSTNPDATPFLVNASGQIISGYTAAVVNAGSATAPSLQINGLGGGASTAALTSWATGINVGSTFLLSRSEGGTIGTQTIVDNNDQIGRLLYAGSDGTSFIEAASITGAVDGTPGTNDMPGRLVFSTTADGASTPTERMRIDNLGRIGINSTALTGYQFRIAGTYASTDTNPIWVGLNGTIPSTATGQAYGFFSGSSTQAAAFTLTGLNHFFASQGAVGAGSTLTNQYGFRANSNLTGATNNYGFYSDIASGTGRWNFYANGTADNYFAGNVGIGTSSPGSKLEVNQGILTINTSDQSLTRLELKNTGTGGRTWDIVGGLPGVNNSQFSIYDVTAAATRMTIDSSGNVGIGTTAPGSALDVKGTLRLSGATSGYVGLAPAAAAGSTTYTLPAADGTSGQVLSTNGSGTLSWASSGGTGTLKNVQVFTSSGTYTRTAGVTRAVVIAVGGGGGGKGSVSGLPDINGGNGGTTSFGSHVSAAGGSGATTYQGAAGGTGGAGATIAIKGQAGGGGVSGGSGTFAGGSGGGQGGGIPSSAGVRGGGGGGASTTGACGAFAGGGGGQGETGIKYTTTVGATETVTIGAGGTGGGGAGGAGYVIVYEYS